MKKLIATGAVTALMRATASPAFAQDADVGDDGVAVGGDVEFVDASQFQAAFALQANAGDASAVADDDSTAEASIDQSLTIDQSQSNGGFDDGFFFVD